MMNVMKWNKKIKKDFVMNILGIKSIKNIYEKNYVFKELILWQVM
jgi:hypothetical protein